MQADAGDAPLQRPLHEKHQLVVAAGGGKPNSHGWPAAVEAPAAEVAERGCRGGWSTEGSGLLPCLQLLHAWPALARPPLLLHGSADVAPNLR